MPSTSFIDDRVKVSADLADDGIATELSLDVPLLGTSHFKKTLTLEQLSCDEHSPKHFTWLEASVSYDDSSGKLSASGEGVLSEFGSKVKGSGSFKVGPENALAFLDVGFDVKGLQALINEFGDGILSPGEFSTYLNQVRHSSAGPTFAKEYPEKFNALVAELRKADAEVRNNISELGQENLAKCFDAVFSDKEFQKLLSKKSLVEPAAAPLQRPERKRSSSESAWASRL